MKKVILSVLAGVMTLAASAQSTNPLNYSGTMYLESITAIETPRYISYEEHAILSEVLTVPAIEVSKIVLDFEKCTITIKDKTEKIKVNGCKKYSTDRGWEVVVYCEYVGGDKLELVWREFGKPYLQQITKSQSGVKITRRNLSTRPVAGSPQDAILGIMQGLNY